jgi:hypothetical protein
MDEFFGDEDALEDKDMEDRIPGDDVRQSHP